MAERFTKDHPFIFRENQADEATLVVGGQEYARPKLTPDRDGNTVLVSQNEWYEWGITVEDWIDFFDYDIYVDCLLGTGFRGVPRDPIAGVIRDLNRARSFYEGRTVIPVDINSGMNGDTGEAELAVTSNLTVSIGSVRKGLLQPHARELIGELVNADIGIEIP